MKRLPIWIFVGVWVMGLTFSSAQGSPRADRVSARADARHARQVDPYAGYDSGSAAHLARTSRSHRQARVIRAQPLATGSDEVTLHQPRRTLVTGDTQGVVVRRSGRTIATGGTQNVVLQRPGRKIVISGQPGRHHATIVRNRIHRGYHPSQPNTTAGPRVVRNHAGLTGGAVSGLNTTSSTRTTATPSRYVAARRAPRVTHHPPRTWGRDRHGRHGRRFINPYRDLHRAPTVIIENGYGGYHGYWSYPRLPRFHSPRRYPRHGFHHRRYNRRPGVYFRSGLFGRYRYHHAGLTLRFDF